jgi:[protein-PII] uridylyltransferase
VDNGAQAPAPGERSGKDRDFRIAALRRELQHARSTLKAAYFAKPDSARLLRGLAQSIDRVLRQAWAGAGLPRTLALLAVGGYGRGELYPHSDVDLLILLPATPDETLKIQLENLVGLFWDIGLDVGHSVRSIDECMELAARDITVQTSLLEARHLAGSRKLCAEFQIALDALIDRTTFFKAKRLEQEQRYARYQDTPYSLEPNLKESPGGLRDLQVILWIARVSKLGTTWRELAVHGLITRGEAAQLAKHLKFLQHLRIRLHYLAGRREDRLLFDFQNALAQQFGDHPAGTRRASEFLMQRYYRTAKSITQLNTILLQNLGARIFPRKPAAPIAVNPRFRIVNELLEATPVDLFQSVPSAILECFRIMQDHPELKGMTAQTLRELWRARPRITPAFRRDPANRRLFMEILQSPRGIVHELRRMNQYGILGRYLRPFGKIVGQMQHDLFHVYTVDQHILMVIRNLRRFTMPEFAHEYPFCSRLMASFERPWVLYVAALFHDIAKGRGGDHSTLGRTDALRFCHNHGLSPADTALVAWLVEFHLVMSSVAQKQDLSNPDTIRSFAKKVKDERHLVALYLLTVADIRGTSPKVWNAWKAKLLEDLFRATRRALRHGQVDYDQDLQERQTEALHILRLYALSETVHKELWAQLDTAYFLRHDAQEIAWHTRTLHYRVDAAEPVVKARLAPIGEGLQVMIYTRDQPELFARICGFFERLNFNIVEAKIHTTRHGYALDSFLVLEAARTANYRDMINLIEHELGKLLTKRPELTPPAPGRMSRLARNFPITPEVGLLPDERGGFLLSVTAGDRPGLLYAISWTLAQYHVNLRSAKITTLGERAEDVFLVSGGALASNKTTIEFETELLKRLQNA